jgi:hypothetical protein
MSAVRPVLKRLHSPDVPELESYSPADPGCFSFLLQAMYGPDGSEGEESFDILVCTPRWLSAEIARRGIIDGRHHLIVNSFDLRQIRSLLEKRARACTSGTWHEAALKLSRLGHWEFEDYEDYDPKRRT